MWTLVCELCASALWFPVKQLWTFCDLLQKMWEKNLIVKIGLILRHKKMDKRYHCTKTLQRLKHRADAALIRGWLGEDVLYVVEKDGLAKGGSLLVQWLSAADSWGTGVQRTRQTGHCYLAGRSKLSQLISTVRSEENASYQCIFAQPRDQLSALMLERITQPHNDLFCGMKMQNPQIFQHWCL